MREIIKLGLILLLVTSIAGVLLGAAYEITKEPIAMQNEKARIAAMEKTLPEAKEFKLAEDIVPDSEFIQEVNIGYSGEEIVGYAVKVSPKGYGGPVEMMVGISAEGELQGIGILGHQETPGLGANAEKPDFSDQFIGKPTTELLEVIKGTAQKENQVEALTGATITSKAVTSGVNEVINLYKNQLSKKEGQ